jgi:hypothetical protein
MAEAAASNFGRHLCDDRKRCLAYDMLSMSYRQILGVGSEGT